MTRNETSGSIIGPATLDFEPKTSTSKIAATASSVIVFTRFLFLKQSENNREDEIGSDAEEASQDNPCSPSVNPRIQPGAYLHRSLFEQVRNEDPDQPEQQFAD
jgi:hypothetical protein